MAHNNVLRWRDGRGWLVLSGGAEVGGEVRAQAIGRAAADGGVAYVSLGNDTNVAEAALLDMEDLGAASGYLVDVLSEDDETIRTKLAEASMIVIESDADLASIRSGLLGAAAEGIEAAFANGAVILAEGLSASAFGQRIALDSGETIDGLGWLEQAFILPAVVAVAESTTGRAALDDQPSALALGIGVGSALVLGPDGAVELWGRKQVTVALGRSFVSSNLSN
jgi:hypothetical protein